MEKIDSKEEDQKIEEESEENDGESSSEEKEENESNKITQNKPNFQRHFLNRSKTTTQNKYSGYIGKSIKSGTSSITNDSSLNNDPASSSRDSEEKK